jgi:hypothetical protein
MANDLGIDEVWGEATKESAGFYERVLGIKVSDRFVIEGEGFQKCLRRFEEIANVNRT